MDDKQQLWPLANDVSAAIYQATRQAIQPVLQDQFANSRVFFPLLMAIGNQPDPLRVEDYNRRFPYTAPTTVRQIFDDVVEAGYAAEEADDLFSPTSAGIKAVESVNDIFYTYLGGLEALPEELMSELAGLLGQLVEAALAASDPAEKWSITNSVRSHPKTEYGPLAKIDQFLDDLNAFRDDAHLASWRSLNLSGRSWEAFSLVWSGEAATAEALAERLAFRGYDEAAYAQSLAELTDEGWLKEYEGGFTVSEEGRRIRQAAEEGTDRAFYSPWNCLEEAEQARLRDLLARLKLALQRLAEANEQPA